MVKNLQVNFTDNFSSSKVLFHQLIQFLKKELDLDISFLIINFISSDLIIEINKKYLNHHYSTDIITFNYSEKLNNLDGELFISYEEADSNAKKFGVPKRFEYFRLIIHGILHLLGYDDQNKNAKLVMKRMENNLLNKFEKRLKIRKR